MMNEGGAVWGWVVGLDYTEVGVWVQWVEGCHRWGGLAVNWFAVGGNLRGVVECGNLVVEGGNLTVERGNLVVEGGNLTVERGNLVVECGNLTVERGNLVVERGNLTVERGNLIVERGNLTVERGNLTVERGNLTVERGMLIVGGVRMVQSRKIGPFWVGG